MKTCRRCGVEKLSEDFYKSPKTKDGRFSVCKLCTYIRKKSYVPKEQRDLGSKLKNLCTKARLRTRSFDPEVDKEYLLGIWEAQEGKCAYSGVPLVLEANHPYAVSLDRIDSSIGYEKGNLQLVCSMVNRMKQEFLEDSFLDMCEKITNNRRKTTQSDGPRNDTPEKLASLRVVKSF